MRYRYQHVRLAGIGYAIPDEALSSDEIERRLAPLYARLRLPAGRLELMTGIRERRLWPAGQLPSVASAISGERALAAAGIDRGRVGALIHASVCRDYLEPATASVVHHRLGLSRDCLVHDCSNACLGLLNGVIAAANMIELGQIEAGLIVGTECSRGLLETTIAALNRDETLSRDDVKLAVASLTIGSASAAILLTHDSVRPNGPRLLGGVALGDTSRHDLCRSGRDEAAGGQMRPLMTTDSEQMLHAGVALARGAFDGLLTHLGWAAADIGRLACHQVGKAHQKLLLESLGLDPRRDFTTYDWLGNTGSVALPVTMALSAEARPLPAGERVAWLGIGSGLNVLMMGWEW